MSLSNIYLNKKNYIFLTLILFVYYLELYDAFIRVNNYYNIVDFPYWGSINAWIEISKCSLEYKTILLGCHNAPHMPFTPFSDTSSADDLGHGLLYSIYPFIMGKAAEIRDTAMFNVLLNFAGISLMLLLIIYIKGYLFALIYLSFISAFSAIDLSPHPGFVGVGIFSFAPVALMCLIYHYKLLHYKFWIPLSLASFFLLSLAALFRHNIAIFGYVLLIVMALLFITKDLINKRYKMIYIYCIFTSLCFISLKAPDIIITIIAKIFPVAPSQSISGHGIAHSLYLGLGEVDNKFGIKWNDTVGANAVHAVDSSVKYVSPEYFDILWQLYKEKWINEPLEMLRIYTVKLGKITTMLYYKIPLILPILLFIFLSSKWLYQWLFNNEKIGIEKILIIASTLYVGLYIIQALLTVSFIGYFKPAIAFMFFIGLLLIKDKLDER